MAEILPHLLLALAAVILTGRLLAKLLGFFGQPPVIGEVIAGILLGPSLIGKDYSQLILPDVTAPYLGALAQLGVILYMFVVGLELNASVVRSRALATGFISLSSLVVPFGLGVGLALWLYPVLSNDDVPIGSFGLFLGVAMSVTAFPVLARILTDRGLAHTPLGAMALGSAAIGDAVAWCFLALVVGVVKTQVENALLAVGFTVAYLAIIFGIIRPAIVYFVRRFENHAITPAVFAWVIVAVLLSAWTTEMIGIHAIFGAFLLGAVVPHQSRLAGEVANKLHGLVTVVLLPAFFAYIGMRTQIGLVAGVEQWLIVGLITLVATAGKCGGAFAASRLCGLDWRTSASLGVLLNSRGLMELIVLNVGLELQVISPTLFAMMVLMALATTIATTPLLDFIDRLPKGPSGTAMVREFPAISASAN